MWITYFFKEFIVIWQANIFLPFKTVVERILLNVKIVHDTLKDSGYFSVFLSMSGKKGLLCSII